MANIDFSRRIKDYEWMIWKCTSPTTLKRVFNSDWTFFWYFWAFENNYKWSNYYIFKFNETTNKFDIYNLDYFNTSFENSLMIIKKNNNFFFFWNTSTWTSFQYFKWVLWLQWDNWIYKITVSNTLTTAFTLTSFSWLTNILWNWLYNNWYFVYWFNFRRVVTWNTYYWNEALTFSITYTWDEINTVTKTWWTYTFSYEKTYWRSVFNFNNYINYIFIGYWWLNSFLVKWWYYYSFKVNSWTWAIESQFWISYNDNWNRYLPFTKIEQKWKLIRKWATYIEFYNWDWTWTTTWISITWINNDILSLYSWLSTFTNQIWLINWSTSSNIKLLNWDTDAISWDESWLISISSNYWFFWDFWSDNFLFIEFDSWNRPLNVFTVSETKWGISYYSTWNWVSNVINIDSLATKLTITAKSNLNSWTYTIEYRLNWGSWVDITNTLWQRITIPTPGSSNYFEVKATLNANAWLTSSPEVDKFVSLQYKTIN